MFLDTSDPRPPPPSPRRQPERDPKAKRDEDRLIALIVFALLLFVLLPFCGGTFWDAAAAMMGR